MKPCIVIAGSITICSWYFISFIVWKKHRLDSKSYETTSGWWFGTCFIFHILGIIIDPNWLSLIFFRGVGRYTTNQTLIHLTSWCFFCIAIWLKPWLKSYDVIIYHMKPQDMNSPKLLVFFCCNVLNHGPLTLWSHGTSTDPTEDRARVVTAQLQELPVPELKQRAKVPIVDLRWIWWMIYS